MEDITEWKEWADRELRRLRAELDQKAEANQLAGDSNRVRVGLTPAPVSGVTVSQQVGTLTIRWNAVPNRDLRYYEVAIADNPAFANATTDTTTSLSYQWDQGEPLTTYYARVRAVALSGATGPFSNAVSSATGQAATDNIEDAAVETGKVFANAITIPNVAYTAGSQLIADGTETEVQSLSYTSTGEAPVFLQFGLEVVPSINTWVGTLRFYRDSTELQSLVARALVSGESVLYAFFIVDEPSAGTVTYRLTTDGPGSASTHSVQSRIITAIEVKR